MKKILAVFLLVFVIGCAKRLPPPAETKMPKEPARETVEPAKKIEKEAVKETVRPKEAKLQEEELALKGEVPAALKEVLNDIFFDYDKYSIRDDARPGLDSIASYLKKDTAAGIIVEGHCDERGTNEYNLALGEKRAKAAKEYLTSRGVAPSRLTVVTYGEEKPVCTEQNEACWQKNRRAHFAVK
ncbi:MAG: peptidoglycan-associated lipoprotein Pal [Nitrospiraceae bacterium]|nr:MAG: peptidoglycan-associated lipoprotein Pal [Nitrospiraceae bacterium]